MHACFFLPSISFGTLHTSRVAIALGRVTRLTASSQSTFPIRFSSDVSMERMYRISFAETERRLLRLQGAAILSFDEAYFLYFLPRILVREKDLTHNLPD